MWARGAVLFVLLVSTSGCLGAGVLSPAEARDAVVESAIDAQAAGLTSSTIEITTTFTLGDGVKRAADELREFLEQNLPCAAISLSEATLTVDYGAAGGGCLHRGQTITGRHAITVVKAEPGEIDVRHQWTALSNGRVEVSGEAHVTWSASDVSRRVVHSLEWTRLADGRAGSSAGEREQRPLEGGVAEGILVQGSRIWTGARGTWHLDIEGVEVRWSDPVPSAGTYLLEAPRGGMVSMTFSREAGGEGIIVDVQTRRRDFRFLVRRSGLVEDLS